MFVRFFKQLDGFICDMDTGLFHFCLVAFTFILILLLGTGGAAFTLLAFSLFIWYRASRPLPPPDVSEFEREFT